MTNCCTFSRWTESFLDGELSPEHTVDFENHLPGCCYCNTKIKFERAVRLSTQRVVRSASQPSEGFEAKLRARMAAERARERVETLTAESARLAAVVTPLPFNPVANTSQTQQHRPLTWRAIAPLSVAAAAALAFAALRGEPQTAQGEMLAGATGNEMARRDTMQTVRDFLDQLATDAEHNERDSWQPPYQIPVNFPIVPESVNVVHGRRITPPSLESSGAFWDGYHFRQVPVQGKVSSWHYRVANHRVLLWVYDSKKLPLRAVLEPHVAHNQPVFVGTHRGRAVAALENNGFGYVATTDLPPKQAAEFVASLGNEHGAER